MLDDAKRLHARRRLRHALDVGRRAGADCPAFFGERDAALADLTGASTTPPRRRIAGWLREVHFHLADVQRPRGNGAQAERQHALSGYAADRQAGDLHHAVRQRRRRPATASAPRAIREVVKDTVYCLSGFEFTEYYFVVSADRRELISIDAGTRPDCGARGA